MARKHGFVDYAVGGGLLAIGVSTLVYAGGGAKNILQSGSNFFFGKEGGERAELAALRDPRDHAGSAKIFRLEEHDDGTMTLWFPCEKRADSETVVRDGVKRTPEAKVARIAFTGANFGEVAITYPEPTGLNHGQPRLNAKSLDGDIKYDFGSTNGVDGMTIASDDFTATVQASYDRDKEQNVFHIVCGPQSALEQQLKDEAGTNNSMPYSPSGLPREFEQAA